MKGNKYLFYTIEEAARIHVKFMCIKNKDDNFLMSDMDILIACCKAHVKLKYENNSNQEYIDALMYWFDNLEELYKVRNCLSKNGLRILG